MEVKLISDQLRNQNGMMLAPVMGILAIIASLALSYTALTLYNHKILLNDKQGEQVLFIAEAGIEDALHELKLNSDWRTGFNQKSLANGLYSVSVQPTTWPNTANALALSSEGKILNSRVKSVITAIVSLGQALFSSAMQSTQNININNSTGTVSGSLTAGTVYTLNGALVVQGQKTNNSTLPVTAPNFSALKNAATVLVTGEKHFTAGTYTGVWYVDGTVLIDSNVTINGTIISTGHIQFGNTTNVRIITGDTKSALISGNTILGSNAQNAYIEGMVYASQSIQLNDQKNCTYIGAIAAPGDISSNNSQNMSVIYNGTYATTPKYFGTETAGSNLKVLAWK